MPPNFPQLQVIGIEIFGGGGREITRGDESLRARLQLRFVASAGHGSRGRQGRRSSDGEWGMAGRRGFPFSNRGRERGVLPPDRWDQCNSGTGPIKLAFKGPGPTRINGLFGSNFGPIDMGGPSILAQSQQCSINCQNQVPLFTKKKKNKFP